MGSFQRVIHLLQVFARRLQCIDGLCGIDAKFFALTGQIHALTDAVEQHRVYTLLQRAYFLAHRRLRTIHAAGRFRQVQAVGKDQERFKLAKVYHAPLPHPLIG